MTTEIKPPWRPIETAPKDGEILSIDENGAIYVFNYSYESYSPADMGIIGWLPIDHIEKQEELIEELVDALGYNTAVCLELMSEVGRSCHITGPKVKRAKTLIEKAREA